MQTSWAHGERDPLLDSREDVSYYYSSASYMENAIPLVVGGFTRRDGLSLKSYQRGALSEIDLGTAILTITAANGGTTGNATDGDDATLFTTTTAIGTTNPYVALEIEFTSEITPSFVDLEGVHFTSLPASVEGVNVSLQRFNGAVWEIVETIVVGTTPYNRRFGDDPTNDAYGRMNSDNKWRIIARPLVDLGSAVLEFTNIRFMTESAADGGGSVGNVKAHRLSRTVSDEYFLVITAGNVDIYRYDRDGLTGGYQASVAIPHTDEQVAEITASRRLDTLTIFHEDVHPYVVQGLFPGGYIATTAEKQWRSGPADVETVPRFAFGDVNCSGGLNAKQVFRTSSMSSGDKVVFEYNGERSAEVTWTTTASTNASAIEAALEGLRDITSVTASVYDGSGANAELQIEFDGVDGLQAWPIVVADIMAGAGTIQASHLVRGRPDTDELWSATRGYPRCGGYYQGRQWWGGFKARLDVLAGSRAGAPYDFLEDDDPIPGSPIVVAPDLDEQVTINAIHAGRHLQIFTSSAELYVPDEPITIDNIALKVATRHGTLPGVTPISVQGATVFLDRNGRALREFIFSDGVQSYNADPITAYGGHLVSQPVSMDFRPGRGAMQPPAIYIANTGQMDTGEDCPASICVIERSQEVNGLVRLTTQGVFKAFISSMSGECIAVVQRDAGGVKWNYIEAFDPEFQSDFAQARGRANDEEFVATAGQTAFVSAELTTTDGLGVFTFSDGRWNWVDPADYTVDTGTTTLTFATGLAVNTRVLICYSRSNYNQVYPEHIGETGVVYSDGVFLAEQVLADPVSLGGSNVAYHRIEFGLRFEIDVRLNPFKGKGDRSPTYHRQRIHDALLHLTRTTNIALGTDAVTPRAQELVPAADLPDPLQVEDQHFTGLKRVAGIPGWALEPALRIAQTEPGEITVRAITYHVRY